MSNLIARACARLGFTFLLLTVILATFAYARQFGTFASGGALSANAAKYDVKYSGLNLKVDPARQHLSGYVDVVVESVVPAMDTLEFDLVDFYTISKIERDGKTMPFTHLNHKIKLALAEKLPAGTHASFRIYYAGNPPVAVRPPWEGGFNWSKDANGKPWIGVSCQGEGGKIWWPSKDHPSDEPDSVGINITIPDSLYCAANGLLQEIVPAEKGWKTFRWKTRYPVNNYNVSINIGDYAVVRRPYRGTTGTMDIVFYVLKSDSAKAPALLEMAEEFLRFYAKYFGEYPWIKEKFGLAHTYYLGMEHQTINAYGNHFRNNALGYDGLMLHEMGHEWWGNYVTVRDWADFWIHEGICSYAEALFLNDKFGMEAYHKYVKENLRRRILNHQPIVPKRDATTSETYNSDIYAKAAVVLHTLRFFIGDSLLLDILKTFASDPAYTLHNRVVSQDFIDLVNRKTGQDLDWFFQQYLFTAKPPTLEYKIIRKPDASKELEIRWRDEGFHMPVEVRATTGDKVSVRRVDVNSTWQRYQFTGNPKLEIDPTGWILMEVVEGK
ncbi:M1 family metallopeptidase [candidate division KSB1 bacterium]|nr:M1 family metallopeptidase [candidate division KSB1 bacterium]